MPPDEAGGHPAPQPDSRPDACTPARRLDTVIVRQGADSSVSVPTADQLADLLALSDERDLQLRLRLAAEAAAYQRGLEAGRILGYRQAARRTGPRRNTGTAA